MIVRFLVLLPFSFYVQTDKTFKVKQIERNGYKIDIYPPLQTQVRLTDFSILSDKMLEDTLKEMVPTDPPKIHPMVFIDDKPTVEANLFQLIFHKDSFRSNNEETDLSKTDPPVTLAFEIVNEWITKIRTLAQFSELKPVNYNTSVWKLDYFYDEVNTKDNPTPHKNVMYTAVYRSFAPNGLTVQLWDDVNAVEEFVPLAWETLMSDTHAVLPDINAAVVLAASALETFINYFLDKVAEKSSLPKELWRWLNERDLWLKNPSNVDKFGDLLKILTGYSLKEDSTLWNSYNALRKLRNNISHEGTPYLNNKLVTYEEALTLIAAANDIINKLESLLPIEERRHRITTQSKMHLRTKMKVSDGILKNEFEFKPMLEPRKNKENKTKEEKNKKK